MRNSTPSRLRIWATTCAAFTSDLLGVSLDGTRGLVCLQGGSPMKACAAFFAVLLTALAITSASADTHLTAVKPEQVGMSSQRLERVGQLMKTQIERGRFPGAVVVITRKGKVAYFETFGQRDPATGAKMSKDAIFRLYSMRSEERRVGK